MDVSNFFLAYGLSITVPVAVILKNTLIRIISAFFSFIDFYLLLISLKNIGAYILELLHLTTNFLIHSSQTSVVDC